MPWLGVSGLGSVSRSPLSLLELAGACCSPSPLGSTGHAQLYRACSSFAIFLRLLALHLSQENAGGAPWRQIKGRLGNAAAAAANAANSFTHKHKDSLLCVVHILHNRLFHNDVTFMDNYGGIIYKLILRKMITYRTEKPTRMIYESLRFILEK